MPFAQAGIMARVNEIDNQISQLEQKIKIGRESLEAAERRVYSEYLHPEQVEEERGSLELDLKEQREERLRIEKALQQQTDAIAAGGPTKPNTALVERIRAENMRTARAAHKLRKGLFPAYMAPLSEHMVLYDRPADLQVFAANIRSHAHFRPVLMGWLGAKHSKLREKELVLRRQYHKYKDAYDRKLAKEEQLIKKREQRFQYAWLACILFPLSKSESTNAGAQGFGEHNGIALCFVSGHGLRTNIPRCSARTWSRRRRAGGTQAWSLGQGGAGGEPGRAGGAMRCGATRRWSRCSWICCGKIRRTRTDGPHWPPCHRP